jgi:hypothetical protein
MGRKIMDQPVRRVRVRENRVRRFLDPDLLKVAVRPRMIVGPQDIARLAIINAMPLRIWFGVLVVEVMRFANAAEETEEPRSIGSRVTIIPPPRLRKREMLAQSSSVSPSPVSTANSQSSW